MIASGMLQSAAARSTRSTARSAISPPSSIKRIVAVGGTMMSARNSSGVGSCPPIEQLHAFVGSCSGADKLERLGVRDTRPPERD